jgi:spore coat protein JB
MAERYERDDRAEPHRGNHADRSDRNDDTYFNDLKELQIVDFALVELSLYLDTHPMDMQAVQQFNPLVQRRQQIASAFELKHGPLMQFGHSFTRFPWQWVDTPWPWQV